MTDYNENQRPIDPSFNLNLAIDMQRAFDQLPPSRHVIATMMLEGWSVEEMCEALKMTKTAVTTARYNTRKALKKLLAGYH